MMRTKITLFIFTILAPLVVHATEWLTFNAAPDGSATHQYDWDSLVQSPDGFEADIRFLKGDHQSAAHLTVNCHSATWQLSKTCLGCDEQPLREEPEPIGNSAIVRLQRSFCVRWQEPEGAHWRELGRTYQGMSDYDDRLVMIPGGFMARVRLLGKESSYLIELHIDCAQNIVTVSSQIARQENSGLVMDKGPLDPMPVEPDTIADLLKSKHCTISGRP